MAEKSLKQKPAARDAGAIEDQLWPIVCATAVLVGVLATVIVVNSDFEDERLLFNGYSQLVGVAAIGAAIIFLGSLIKGRARRTAELAILLSLALHAAGGLGAGFLFGIPITVAGNRPAASDASIETDEDAPPPADYHWGQNDDSATEQAFEKPMDTRLRDQMPPAAQVQPRNLERPVPVAEIPKATKADLTPLGASAATEPGKPLDVRRPDAAKVDDLPPAQALAMARRKSDELSIPDAPAPAPLAMPEAPKEDAKSIEARGVQVEKSEKYYWATVAKKMADPNNLPIPAPHGKPGTIVQASDSLPSPEIVARLPSQAPPATSVAQAGAEAADKISQQGGSRDRSDRAGTLMPSTAAADGGLQPTIPAAAGGAQGSRLDRESNVPVEASDSSHAPLGPAIASAGTQDFARGSSLLPTRRGTRDGQGRAQPAMEGESVADPGQFRSGSPDSNLTYGLAMAAGPARRAMASQTEGSGSGPSADQSARLPRTQAETGVMLPAGTRIADDSNLPGAGGIGTRPGGMTSMLDVNQNIAVRRTVGSGTLRGSSHSEGLTGTGAGDVPLNSYTGAVAGLGPVGPRRVDQGSAEGTENGLGSIPRSRAQDFDPRATIDPVGPVSGNATVSHGPVQGTGPQGYAISSAGPELALGGTPRLYAPGQRIGARPAASLEPSEIASSVAIAAPQHASAGGRGSQGDGQLDQILSGGEGGVGRGRGAVMVNSLVHEPLDAFRHGPIHGGPALGDSTDGQLTEPAIENGLAYFAGTQLPDGHWSLHETPQGIPRDPPTNKDLHADTAATGLALLSYMAAGYTHEDEKYRQTVRRGIAYLVQHQAADGDLSYRGSDATHFYSHGIAAMALCEAYGMTQDRDLREPAQKAIDYIVRSQDPNRGGWRYRAQEGSDTSVTGWQLMALRSAQMAGLSVPDETLHKIGHWLDLAQVPNHGTYVYNPWNLDTEEERKAGAPNPTMTAQAMIMRMYLGQDHDPNALRQGADYLKEHLPDFGVVEGAPPDCYYWYYATQAMYHMQGDYWKVWDARVTPLLRAGQIDKGPLKGSWSPSDPLPDRWGDAAGRHYVTAMHVLTLEFRYWHLPLFRELRRPE